MANPKKILVAYDGSPQSKVALDWAMLLGVTSGAGVEAIKVFEPTVPNYMGDFAISTDLAAQYAELEKTDRQMMEEVKKLCKDVCKMKVHVDLLKGNVASTLLDHARNNGFDLIVTGTKGHGLLAEMLVGSVTNSLVSLSKVPVLVVKEQQAPARLQKLLVAYDGSEFANAALDMAIDISKSSEAQITAVKVIDPMNFSMIYSMAESGSAMRLAAKLKELDEAEYKLLDGAKSAAALKGMEIATELLQVGNIADSIIQYSRETNADMIVAGTLGHGLLDELLIGSVTRNLISLSKLPVLVVKK
jgi:nucleotide-binding universal stress UspA family protein